MAKKKSKRAGNTALCNLNSKNKSQAKELPERKIPALFLFFGLAWLVAVLYVWFSSGQFQNLKMEYYLFHFGQILGSFGIPFFKVLPKYILQFLLFSLLALSCHGIGRLALSYFKKQLSIFEDIIFSFSIGLLILSSWIFSLSVIHLLYPVAVWIFVICGLTAGIMSLRKDKADFSEFRTIIPSNDKLSIAALVLIVAYTFLIIVPSFAPEIFYDGLIYHLGVPNIWIQHHGFTYLPYNIYSNLFMFHAMIYSACLCLDYSATLPKLFNYYAVIISLVAIIGITRRFMSQKTWIWGCLFFISYITVAVSVSYAGTETFSVMFCTVSLYAALRALLPSDSENDSKEQWHWIVLSGLLAGCAMAVKATCLLFSSAIMIMILVHFLKGNTKGKLKSAARTLAVFVVAASIPVLPWLIKNIIYCGNPFFPFATSLFGLPAGYSADQISGFMADTMPRTSFKSWITHPYDLLHGNVFGGDIASPLLYILLPFIAFIFHSNPVIPLLAVFFVAGWLSWSAVSAMPRFLMPALPAAFILIAEILQHLPVKIRKCMQMLAIAQGLFMLAMALCFISKTGFFQVVFNRVGQDEFLSTLNTIYPMPSYPAMAYTNKNLPPDAKIIFLGDARSFYLRRDSAASSVFNSEPLADYASRSENADDMYDRLTRDGFTHIIFNPAECLRNKRHLQFRPPHTREVFKDFFKNHVNVEWAGMTTFQNKQAGILFVISITDIPGRNIPPNFIEMQLASESK